MQMKYNINSCPKFLNLATSYGLVLSASLVSSTVDGVCGAVRNGKQDDHTGA